MRESDGERHGFQRLRGGGLLFQYGKKLLCLYRNCLLCVTENGNPQRLVVSLVKDVSVSGRIETRLPSALNTTAFSISPWFAESFVLCRL